MKKLLFVNIVLFLISCNSYNSSMNKLLSEKKIIEIRIDSIDQQESRFRLITGYNEMDDSLALNTQYPHPELVDSIYYLKLEKKFLNERLESVKYSIDSLQKLK